MSRSSTSNNQNSWNAVFYKIKLDRAENRALYISTLYAKAGKREEQEIFCKHAFTKLCEFKNVHDYSRLKKFNEWLDTSEKIVHIYMRLREL